MTRPKADSDPWLTDMVTRDREVAKTVVYGLRDIQTLLRGIRDVLAEEMRAARMERQQMREEIRDLWEATGRRTMSTRERSYERCDRAGCSLPMGHLGNHKGSLRSA